MPSTGGKGIYRPAEQRYRMTSNEQTMSAPHPLRPLTEREIERASRVLDDNERIGDASRIVKIELDEPSKEALRAYETDGASVAREAFVVVRDSTAKETYEAVVSLDEGVIASWEHVEGAQPSIAIEEFLECEATVKENPEWQEAVRKRGVENTDLAMVDPWSVGWDFIPEGIDRSRRLAHGMTYVRTAEDEGDEGYARPITGLHTFVDLDEMEVVEIVDNGPPDDEQPLPPEDMAYREGQRDLREDLRPYDVVQPDGPSWEVEGHEVAWQNWRIRVGWTQREGLVLHDVRYEDDGRSRKVLHRASLAEMAVPYGDPSWDERFRNAMDVGEYNVGRLAKSLEEDCDCLGDMHYWDAVMNTMDGDVRTLPNAICLHEEDYGLLWERTDWRTESSEVRRNRRLVISFIAAVGNYDYAFYWYFYQDGSIQVQVRLTGIDQVSAAAQGDDGGGYAELVAPQLKAMIHQHFFCFRLDLDVDGEENALYRVENQAVPHGPGGFDPHAEVDGERLNPGGNAFYAKRTKLATESEAQELIDPLNGRYWSVTNPGKTNRLGQEVGYKLVPETNVEAAMQPDSSVLRRSGFVRNHLWATPYREDERFPAGRYPNQSEGEGGLPAWTEADRNIDGEDLVLWYTLGVNHVTRPEDWPVLPVQIANVRLMPTGFFEENPAIDVPPQHAIGSNGSADKETGDSED